MSKKTQDTKITETKKIQIRNDFVQGIEDENGMRRYPTLDELHKKYIVAKSTLYRLAKKEQWRFEREKFQQGLVAKLDEKKIEEKANESEKFDNTSITLAKSLMATVGQAINKMRLT